MTRGELDKGTRTDVCSLRDDASAFFGAYPMGISEVLDSRKSDIAGVAARYGARNIRVFGSVARGDAGPGSDVDLLVELAPGTTLLRHAAFERELQALLGRRVHVVSERGLRPRVRDRVSREALPL